MNKRTMVPALSAGTAGNMRHKLTKPDWILSAAFSLAIISLTSTSPARAAQFAYVANSGSANVSVIDTATNTVTTTVAVGTSPRAVAITPDGAFVYIVNQGSGNVSMIDTATNTVTTTVAVGANPRAIAITPDGAFAYVANQSSANVSVINTATNTVIKTVNVGSSPQGVAITPDGAFSYVANAGSNSVSVINTATNTVTMTVSVGNSPQGVAITPDGTFAYVGNALANSVSVIDTATNTVTATVTVGGGPLAVAISPDGTFAFVPNYSSSNVSVIDTATNTVTATVAVGTNPRAVSIAPDGAFAYVTNEFSNNVSVIDTTTNTVTTTVTVGSNPFSIAITPPARATPFVYVANQNSNTVSVIDATTNTVTATVSVDSSPRGVAITPDGAFVYVAKRNSNIVSVIDTATNTVTATVTVGSGPFGVAITPDGAFAYVTNEFSNTVSVIDTATNTVTATVAVGSGPFGVAITPNGDTAYIVNQNSTNISVIDTATNSVIATVTVGSAPRGIAIAPDGTSVYVTSLGPDNVSVIDTATNTVTTTVNVGANPFGVAITPDGAFAYVANSGTNNVSVIGTAANTVITTFAVGSGPLAVAITPDGAFAYVTNSGSANVSVIDTATNTVTTTAAVGTNPFGIAIALLVTDTTPPDTDTTPPLVAPSIAGTLGSNAWYTSSVNVSWTVTDAESPITSQTGCGASSITADTMGVALTCSATSTGGTTSESVNIKRDATAPLANASALPIPNGNGWNNSNVTVNFVGNDATSGVASCTAGSELSFEGANQSSPPGTCTDNAGNVSGPAFGSGINIDMTAPLVTASAAPVPNGAGWNNTAVIVTFLGSDSLSGVAVNGCTPPTTVSTNGAGQSASGGCSDRAGNTGATTYVGLNIDTTRPTSAATTSPAPNADGWNNTDVTVEFSGTDSLSGSGIATCSPPAVLTTEGLHSGVQGFCTDIAGNDSSNNAAAPNIRIDKTAPAVPEIFLPVPNDGFVLEETPATNYSCADGLSGIAACTHGAIDTSSLGTKTFAVIATDRAGNSRSSTSSFTVNLPNTVIITTVAGNGAYGFSGDGGAATSASLRFPGGVAVDAAGNLYIADGSNRRIRRVSPGGIMSTVAGNGVYGFSGDGGAATSASLSSPSGVAVDAAGNLYIADPDASRIRRVSSGGIISTVAGNGTQGFSGDGGAATSASLSNPYGVAVDAAGNLYIADRVNKRIRRVSADGIMSTVAGNGTSGFSGDGGAATSASLSNPFGVAVDAAGNLYIADPDASRIRRVSSGGIISTVAGNGTSGFSGDGGAATSASLNNPVGVAVDAAGNLYIADLGNKRIRRVSAGGIMSTVAGNGTSGFSGDGGAATSASLSNPFGVAVDAAGNLYSADGSNNRIRRSRDTTYTLAPMAVFGSQALNVSSAPREVTLTNRGPQPVAVTSITITGTNATQFSQTNNCGIQTFQAVETTCTINVVFRPTANGAMSAVLNVNTAGGTGTKSVALSGTGGPTFVLDPYGIAFGNQAVGLTTSPKTVTLTNTGTLPLPISSISINGTNGNQFSQTNNCVGTVASGASCTINAVFRPTTVGSKTANLNVNAGGGAGSKIVVLTGTGTPPTFTLSPGLLAFNYQAVSVPSAAMTVTLTNTGAIPVPITSVTDSGPNADQFTEIHSCGSSVPVGASCTISVTFLPTSSGTKTASLVVTSGGGAATQAVPLTGTGVIPAFSVTPTSIIFPNQLRKTKSDPLTVIVLNSGIVQMQVTTVALGGVTPNQFSLLNSCTAPIAAGGSCTITVYFQPTSAGSKSAILNVTAGGGAGTKTVGLSGTGT